MYGLIVPKRRSFSRMRNECRAAYDSLEQQSKTVPSCFLLVARLTTVIFTTHLGLVLAQRSHELEAHHICIHAHPSFHTHTCTHIQHNLLHTPACTNPHSNSLSHYSVQTCVSFAWTFSHATHQHMCQSSKT